MKELVFNNPIKVYSFFMDKGYLLLQWPDKIDDLISQDVIQLAKDIKSQMDHIVDLVPAYCSLGIFYNDQENYSNILQNIRNIKRTPTLLGQSKIIEVPVCYDDKFAIDVKTICSIHQLTKKQLIEIHCQPIYQVSFLGFLPGFMYLSGLNDRLITKRKSTPRLSVPRGAVAIGGKQTGIYPISSPGGWHIIGNCPYNLFDISASVPSRFNAGDRIKMVPISLSEYNEIYQSENHND